MRKYIVKRVMVAGLGWQLNENRNMWEMWHNGKTHWCFTVTTKTVIHDFIEYNWNESKSH